MDLKTLNDTPPWDWPADTRDKFLAVLSDPKAHDSDRFIAARLAGDITVIDDTLANLLLAIVRDAGESERMRTAAAIALGPVLEQADIYGFDVPGEVPITRQTFRNIQESFRTLQADDSIPKDVRRRILEASVRAPKRWHAAAIRAAYASGDKDWVLTAVFAMQWIKGFDRQILEALQSSDRLVQAEAAEAAGNWGVAAAWPHVVALVEDLKTPKPVLLAAIGAVAGIRPAQAREVLDRFEDTDDDEIAEAVGDALGMVDTSLFGDLDFDDDDLDDDEPPPGGWIN